MKYRNSVLIRQSWTAPLLPLAAVATMACAAPQDYSNSSDWVHLTYVVDVASEISFAIPPAPMKEDLEDVQFVSTSGKVSVKLFSASYDPGSGKDRDLLLTHLNADVFRIEKDDEAPLSLSNIVDALYVSRNDFSERFDVIGEVVFSGRSWIQINLIGEPLGISYLTPIRDNLALNISLTVYNQSSNQTRLFRQRQRTLESILSTVKISNVTMK